MSRTSSTLRLAAFLTLGIGVIAPAAARADRYPRGPQVPPPVQPRPVPEIQVPDLTIQGLPTYLSAPDPAGVTTVDIRARVANRGLARTAGPFSVRVTLSLIAPGMDLPWRIFPTYTQRVTRGVAGGTSLDLTLSAPFAITAPRGTTILIEYEVDYLREVGELNETNNVHRRRIVTR